MTHATRRAPLRTRLRTELFEPWGILAAGVLGGATWAGIGPATLGIGVGATVYGAKVVIGTATSRRHNPPAPAPLRPRYGSPAGTWLKRAESAVSSLQNLARGEITTATDGAAVRAAEEASLVLVVVKELAGQSAAVATALASADSPGLDDEAANLQQRADTTRDDAAAQQSAEAVADRVAVRDRLRQAQTALDARLQSSALSLESLVARIAELKAISSSVGELDPSMDDLASLTTEVEGLRRGLAEAQAAAKQALA